MAQDKIRLSDENLEKGRCKQILSDFSICERCIDYSEHIMRLPLPAFFTVVPSNEFGRLHFKCPEATPRYQLELKKREVAPTSKPEERLWRDPKGQPASEHCEGYTLPRSPSVGFADRWFGAVYNIVGGIFLELRAL
jgi:hypothetical protein